MILFLSEFNLVIGFVLENFLEAFMNVIPSSHRLLRFILFTLVFMLGALSVLNPEQAQAQTGLRLQYRVGEPLQVTTRSSHSSTLLTVVVLLLT
jgi:hypothetical protein